MKDLYSHISIKQAIAPILVLDATVPAAVDVDLAGCNSAVIEISNAEKPVGDTGTITLAITHADDTGAGVAGSYTNVAAADILGATPASGVVFTLATALQLAAVTKVGYVGGKRFIKLTLAEANANSTGTIIGINVIESHLLDVPAI